MSEDNFPSAYKRLRDAYAGTQTFQYKHNDGPWTDVTDVSAVRLVRLIHDEYEFSIDGLNLTDGDTLNIRPTPQENRCLQAPTHTSPSASS